MSLGDKLLSRVVVAWFALSAACGGDIIGDGSAATSASSANTQNHFEDSGSPSTVAHAGFDAALDNLRSAQTELELARRLLNAMEDQPVWRGTYLARLDATLDQLDGLLDGQSDVHVVARLIAMRLEAARLALLDTAPTVRDWATLARALDPGAQLIVPDHLIERPRRATVPLDLDDVAASLWVQRVTA